MTPLLYCEDHDISLWPCTAVTCLYCLILHVPLPGGFLAATLAAHHPDDVKGVVLLNAAPYSAPHIPGRGSALWRLLEAAADDAMPVSKEVSSQ